jgi:hypothetical protein
VGNAEVGKIPDELRSERETVIGLNLLDGKGKMLPKFSDEVDSSLRVVVFSDAQDA